MTALPPITDFSNAPDNGHVKTFFGSMRDFLAGILGADGTIMTALKTLCAPMAPGVFTKTASYTVTSADLGRVIRCTGTWTMSFNSSSSLGNGFNICVRNAGTGTITLDPAGSELIDDAATLAIPAGVACFVVCSGSALHTVGRNIPATIPNPLPVTQGGTGAQTAAGALAAIGAAASVHSHAYVSQDAGADNVGSFCLCLVDSQTSIATGATLSGAILRPSNAQGVSMGSALSGTWRACCHCAYDPETANCGVGLFQRIL